MHVDITKEKKLQHDLEVNNLQLNNLTEYLNTIREDEREYLSAEIHDKFSTALATITRRMTAMKQNIADEETLKKIDYILFTADDARNIVSKLIAEIRTDKLKNLGLITAIRAYARYFEENNPIKVKLFTEEIKDADPAATHVLYRIVQESLNNVASHAKASVVEIYLKQKKGRLHCKIADNGVGISVKDIDLSKDHCIYFMQKRVENLGGKFSISGKKNKGTTINFDLPVKKKIRNENIDL
jgi:signal transduction histidine kinase